MGLLKSTKNIPGVDYVEYRDSLYWKKFKYRARIKFLGIRHAYFVNSSKEWVSKVKNLYAAKKDTLKYLLNCESIITNYLIIRDNLKKQKAKEYSIRMEGQTLAVFSNDLSFLQEFKKWHNDIVIDYTEVIANEFSGVKYFAKEPKNKYRIYFKSKRVEETFHENLKEFLNRNSYLVPSNGLKHWMTTAHASNWRRRYCSATYFIDYDDESTLSYLLLCHGDILGKKYKLEKRVKVI